MELGWLLGCDDGRVEPDTLGIELGWPEGADDGWDDGAALTLGMELGWPLGCDDG